MERCASIDLSTTPPLAIKDNRSRLPLLSRRGNLLADTLSLELLGQALKPGAGRMSRYAANAVLIILFPL
jgi:hypothetical protein